MENFSTVLWIVVIAAAMIFNVVSQSRKQAKKQARAGRRQARRQRGMAVMGSGSGPATCTSERRPVRQEVQPGPWRRLRPRRWRRRPDSKTRPRRPVPGTLRTSAGAATPPKDRLTAAEHPHAAYDDAQEDVSAEIAEDFDLRRAVIYSEILKPKFDE